MQRILTLCLSMLVFTIYAQTYSDHFGEGHTVGVTISSSDNNGTDDGIHSLSGYGNFTDDVGSARFLGQATMGANYEAIQQLTTTGINNWLDSQFAIPASSYQTRYEEIYADVLTIAPNSNPRNEYLSFTFYEMLIKEPDVLRHKVAFALSQIFVIAPINSGLNNRLKANSNYYDLLYQGAFENFHTLLTNVSLHPAMGIYLSHWQNKKADVIQGTLPDENFAREIMQLFTIGLNELNKNGTLKLDSNGNAIPTYSILDVQELAKVFTGLSGGAAANGCNYVFDATLGCYDVTIPMAMFPDYHQSGEKIMIDGTVLPSGQDGMLDITQALEILFNHDNVGPFIGYRLIQHLVKSNPSPEYIARISATFNNNGSGVRGDLGAVVRAILTDPEARDCVWIDALDAGKLIQPMERFTDLFLAFDVSTPSNRFWFSDAIGIYDKVEQSFLAAPTVFNFFTPFYSESNHVQPNNLVSPEFQILSSTAGINYLNEVENRVKDRPFRNRTLSSTNGNSLSYNPMDEAVLDYSDEINIYDTDGMNALIDRLDLILAKGQLSTPIKNIIINTLQENLINVNGYTTEDLVHDAIYYIMLTPDYTILK